MPFVGEGDIALELYGDRPVYAADLDPERIATFKARRADADARVADCDGWPFPDVSEPFAVADLDAYKNPYRSLAAFWQGARTTRRVVIFGTDGMRLRVRGFTGRKNVLDPLPSDGEHQGTENERREQFNFWWARFARPHIESVIAPATIADESIYQRQHMLYWGIAIDRAPADEQPVRPEADRDQQVEDALYEAAISGNVPAITSWLQARRPERWGGRAPSALVPLADLAKQLGFDDEA